MELHQIRYFIAAAELGSISRAAARCRVTQPSLSQQLKKLEDQLGIKLFDRLGRGVCLTEAGELFLPRARRIIAEVKDAEAHLKSDIEEGAGRVTIGAIPTMAPYLIPQALSDLKKQNNKGGISIIENFTDNLIEALINNQVDFALVSTPIESDLIDLEVIAKDELLVVVPKDYNIKNKGDLTINKLREEELVILEDLHCLGGQIQSFCSSRNFAPKVVCKTTQLSTIFKLVALNVGISIIPEMAAVEKQKSGCRFIRIKQNKPFREVAVAWRKDKTRPKRAVEFVQHLKQNLSNGLHRL